MVKTEKYSVIKNHVFMILSLKNYLAANKYSSKFEIESKEIILNLHSNKFNYYKIDIDKAVKCEGVFCSLSNIMTDRLLGDYSKIYIKNELDFNKAKEELYNTRK